MLGKIPRLKMRPDAEGGSIEAGQLYPVSIEGVLGFTIENPDLSADLYVEMSTRRTDLIKIVRTDVRTFGSEDYTLYTGKIWLHCLDSDGNPTNGKFVIIKKIPVED